MISPVIHNQPGHPPTARRIEVIEVTFNRGTGVDETSPVRRVVAYYDMDGKLLAEADYFPQGVRGLGA